MSDLATKTRTVSLKVLGERSAEADIAFIDRGDLDREAFGPDAFQDGATGGVYRNHDGLRHGDQPPFGIVTVHKRGDRWSAAITFLRTRRGDEEHAVAKAFHDAGVAQDVSVGMLVEQTGPVPDHLRPDVDRYLTRVKLLELSFVTIGAIPHAQVTAVKCDHCGKATHSDPAVGREAQRFAQTVKKFERTLARADTLGEPQGALALDVAEKAVRWLSNGREHEPPVVKFFDYDGVRGGYWDPGEPEAIYISRGLSDEELVRAVGHELSHWRNPTDFGEMLAELEAESVLRRYYQSFTA
jgi:hypothetical protein